MLAIHGVSFFVQETKKKKNRPNSAIHTFYVDRGILPAVLLYSES